MIEIELKHLIISKENDCVCTYTPRILTANSLVKGNSNLYMKSIAFSTFWDFDKISDRAMFYSDVYKFVGKAAKLEKLLNKNIVSDEWVNLQQVLFWRQDALFYLEGYTASAVARLTPTVWDKFYYTAESEIAKCNPETGLYSSLITEYSDIVGTTVKDAYTALKLRVETDNAKKFRIQALYDKWADKINQLTNPEDLIKVKPGIRQDLGSV